MKKTVKSSLANDPLIKRLIDGYLYLIIAFIVVGIAIIAYYQYMGFYKLNF